MSRSHKNIRYDSLIIDSGPLLIALTVNYLTVKEISDHKSYLKRVWNKFADLNLNGSMVSEYFRRISNFHTTPHAIGELIGLAKSRLNLKLPDQNEFWAISIEYLEVKNIKENFIKILDLYHDEDLFNAESGLTLIQEIGFIDSELIKLAKEIGLPILTIDSRTLKAKADKQGVDVIVLDEDIYKPMNSKI